jgi:transcriptional regulator with XRE-family HTH domain
MQNDKQSTVTPQEIIRKLKKFKESRGMNVAQLAAFLKISSSTVGDWFKDENSRPVPTKSSIQKILQALDEDRDNPVSTNPKLFSESPNTNGSGQDDENQNMTTVNNSNGQRAKEDQSPPDYVSRFANTEHFQDEIYGEIFLSPMERDLIDTPEFLRWSGKIEQVAKRESRS